MKIEQKYELDLNKDLIQQILEYRNLNADWLTADKTKFNDGSTMYNFQKGYELIQKYNGKKIGILIDSDCDGFCSAAIMYKWLMARNPNSNLVTIIPEGKVHGILLNLIPTDLDLLIIPDASTSENHLHEKVVANGTEILILDHHEFSQEESLFATIINPHNPKCSYPNKNISGTGVVYKFIEAIDILEGQNVFHEQFLDLVAIATVADVMNSTNLENKAIMNIGLNDIINPYVQAYLKADLRIKDKPMNPIVVSFYLAPQINALVRVGTIEEKNDFFQALIGELPAEIVVANIIKLKGKQDRKKDPIVTRIVMNLQKENKDKLNIIFGEIPAATPRSMTGLIAGQLSGMYNKPTFLGRINDEGNCIGSARGVNDSNLKNLKDFCVESNLFTWARGHQSAFGFEIPKENIDKFVEYAEQNLPPFEKSFAVDFKLKGDKGKIVEDLIGLTNHYGPGFPEILVYDEFLYKPEQAKLIQKTTNTLIITTEEMVYIQFRTKRALPTEQGIMRVVGKPNINEWDGTFTPQIMIEEWEWVPMVL